jgi:hypothetical protein
MKKSILSIAVLFIAFFASAQTATNFNCNDCAANNHDLFTELAAGKVIVITWVMPCGACIAPASTAANTVAGYASSDPGRVKFYLVDDYGNSTCNTLSSWASTNSISSDAIFSNSAISMSDYGTAGMPKTVVIGGSGHTVFLNQNGTVTVSAIQNAINSALATSIAENPPGFTNLELFPNPVAGNTTTVSYELTMNSDVRIDIYNTLGAIVKSVVVKNQTPGKHATPVDMSAFSNGIYFFRLGVGEYSQTTKVIVAK